MHCMYLARDLVGADGELDGLLAEAEVRACHHQRRRDPQPPAERGGSDSVPRK